MTPSRTAPAPAVARPRAGMTLVEVVVAMLILTGVLLVLGGFSARFAQANGQAQLVVTANEIAATRLDDVRMLPKYDLVETLATPVNGRVDTVRIANTVYTRSTTVRREGGATAADSVDYKTVTVKVMHPQMRKVVSKTTVVAAF